MAGVALPLSEPMAVELRSDYEAEGYCPASILHLFGRWVFTRASVNLPDSCDDIVSDYYVYDVNL